MDKDLWRGEGIDNQWPDFVQFLDCCCCAQIFIISIVGIIFDMNAMEKILIMIKKPGQKITFLMRVNKKHHLWSCLDFNGNLL